MMPAVAFASQLERELTAVTEQREYWANLWADLARECVKDIAKVEREVVTLTQQRDQWKDKYIQQNKDLGHELRDPNGTIWSECKRLQTELDAVTKQRDGLRSGIDYASDQLHTVTEQRDELLRYNEAFRKETLICADCDAIRKEEYDQAIEQRDRLAEALKLIATWHSYDELHDEVIECEDFAFGYDVAIKISRKALQSLTPNEL
jgi:hypothetical protein